MGKGRKKIPTAIKKTKGTLRKDREVKNEMMPPDFEGNNLAKLVNPYAQKVWLKYSSMLGDMGVLKTTDEEMLIAYCNEYAIYLDCMDKVRELGYTQESKSNGEIISNFLKIGNKALDNSLKLATQYGFTPASRSKIEVSPNNPKDILEDFD